MKHTMKTGILAVGLAAGLLTAAGPAVADTSVFQDARDDVRHGVDIESVKLVNEKNVRVVIQHEDLRRSPWSGASGSVYLDTDRTQKGPEYIFAGGFFDGTDYALLRADGWKADGRTAEPLTCSHEMNLDFRNDVTRLRISRACLKHPGEVRIAVKASGQRDRDTVNDWLHSRRHLTRWVAKG